jgi:DNA-binding response OmpR family regulator
MVMRLLVFAADSAQARTVLSVAKAERFAVDLASPNEALSGVELDAYEVVVLDLDVVERAPGDSLSVLRQLRRDGWSGGILALKTSSSVSYRVAALNAGADDFLSKPADPDELTARIQALVRRGGSHSAVLCVGDLQIDSAKRRVRRGDRTIVLTRREFDLLEFLVRHRERPVTRASIVRHVWNHHFDGLTNVVDVYIAYLRRKIDDGFALKLICTERGVGYVVRDPIGIAGASLSHSLKPARTRGTERC